MTDSILQTMKEMVLGNAEDDSFDTELITHINTCFVRLKQLGVGGNGNFRITGSDETWTQFFGEDASQIDMVKDFMYFNLRIWFDQPQNSSVLSSFQDQLNKFEWLLNVEAETDWENT